MIERQPGGAAQATLLSSEPQLFVADFAASIDFYTTKLGFAVAFTYGEPPFYGQVFRGAARINLRLISKPVIDPHLRDSENLLSATVTLDDALPIYEEFHRADVSFHQRLEVQPWGALTFIVRDVDGNLILFSGQAD